MKLESIRREYKKAELEIADVTSHPFPLFETWINEALKSNQRDATAFSLITIGEDSFPQSRIVLLKQYTEDGFVFYTNYQSQKGKAIEKNSRVGMHFFWPELERQIRISGFAEKTSSMVSDKYFHSRPLESQIAAVISGQSSAIPNRKYIEEQFERLKNELRGNNPERPEYWGGYLVRPKKFEFWQGRENRLHDRIVYEKNAEEWKIKRLAP